MSDLETINHDLHFIYLVVRTLVILFLVTALAPLIAFGLYILGCLFMISVNCIISLVQYCCHTYGDLILEFLSKLALNFLIIAVIALAFGLIGTGIYYRITAKRIFQFENND